MYVGDGLRVLPVFVGECSSVFNYLCLWVLFCVFCL